jgi:hypothetical protein
MRKAAPSLLNSKYASNNKSVLQTNPSFKETDEDVLKL